jgi:hypothetical protein
MPRPTISPPPPASPLDRAASLEAAAAPLVFGALLAWLELGGGFALNPPDGFARAEAHFFYIWRPWILILAAVAAGQWAARRRIGLYAATLLIAAAGETILLLGFGAAHPWAEMLRGLALGVATAAAADVAAQFLRRRHKILGSLVASLLLGGLVFAASGTRPYEALILGPTAPRDSSGPKPPLLFMTALPIIWGEGGAFDPESRPAESYRALEREFDVTPIDAIEPETLRGRRLMLLAQPRLLAPEELVALDAWVRAGGRVLLLTDPALAAAREFPPTDMRRPPETGLLRPLLDHWGLRLHPGISDEALYYFTMDGLERRLAVDHPGRLAATGNSCRIAESPLVARCRIGAGEALVVADADLLTDETWAPAGPPRGHERHLRLADNPILVAGWLDGLAGVIRERSDRPVAWSTGDRAEAGDIIVALLPGLAALGAGLALFLSGLGHARRGRRSPTNLSTGVSTENSPRTDVPFDP